MPRAQKASHRLCTRTLRPYQRPARCRARTLTETALAAAGCHLSLAEVGAPRRAVALPAAVDVDGGENKTISK